MSVTNAWLDAEAERLWDAPPYVRIEARRDARAGSLASRQDGDRACRSPHVNDFANGQSTEALALGVALPDSLTLTIDYGQSLHQMIAAGRYDWINGDVTSERFAVVGEGIVQFAWKVFHFDCDMLSEKAIGAIRSADVTNPWRPARIEHLLAFGAKHREEQRRFPILALASVARVHGVRYVPCLSRDGCARRHLSLPWWHSGWNRSCRFLATRKLPSAALGRGKPQSASMDPIPDSAGRSPTG